jgi:hypothetical protein
MPKFVILTLAGVAAREIDAMIESPLLLFELGGNIPTPGFTGDSVAPTALPGCVPWKPVLLSGVPPGVPKMVIGNLLRCSGDRPLKQ